MKKTEYLVICAISAFALNSFSVDREFSFNGIALFEDGTYPSGAVCVSADIGYSRDDFSGNAVRGNGTSEVIAATNGFVNAMVRVPGLEDRDEYFVKWSVSEPGTGKEITYPDIEKVGGVAYSLVAAHAEEVVSSAELTVSGSATIEDLEAPRLNTGSLVFRVGNGVEIPVVVGGDDGFSVSNANVVVCGYDNAGRLADTVFELIEDRDVKGNIELRVSDFGSNSERKKETSIQAPCDGFFEVDFDGSISAVNTNAELLVGIKLANGDGVVYEPFSSAFADRVECLMNLSGKCLFEGDLFNLRRWLIAGREFVSANSAGLVSNKSRMTIPAKKDDNLTVGIAIVKRLPLPASWYTSHRVTSEEAYDLESVSGFNSGTCLRANIKFKRIEVAK